MAGYSKRTLVQKLGIAPGMRLWLVNQPAGYEETLGPLPQGATRVDEPGEALAFIHYFAVKEAALVRDFPALKKHLAPSGMLWLSWPKGASSILTDLNREHVRRIGLDGGLVDVKVCAVDEDWSALKFVYRKADR